MQSVEEAQRRTENIKHVKSTVKQGDDSAMVWGCFSAADVGELIFIDIKINVKIYLTILPENLKNECYKGKNFKIVQILPK